MEKAVSDEGIPPMPLPNPLLLLLLVLTVLPPMLEAAEGKKKKKKAEEAAKTAAGATGLPGGMVFAPNWLPETLNARRELLESLEFYCRASIQAAKAKDRASETPKFIVGNIRWRMTYDEAVETLPKGCNKITERTLVHSCMPVNSLTVCGFQFKHFMDRGQPFNQMFLVLDKERRVVAVQFVNQTGNDIKWFPKPDGVREPYYNLIHLTFNGSTTKEVPYQLLGGVRGALCVKTAFKDRPVDGKVYENVHWYLPAPFAHSILDIVQVYRKAGVIR